MSAISWWRNNFGQAEIYKIAESISNEDISQGKVTEEFEKAIADTLNVKYVVATTSGSTALLMALIAADVNYGDEVIIPNRTWIATAHAPYLLGAKVILVDVEADRPNMDIAKVEEKITSQTKVIIPVHLNGRSVSMKDINRLASKHGLHVIEDTAQAFYSKDGDEFLGTQSFAGCFSLSVAKIISTGQGGFVVTNNKDTYERLKLIRGHGVRDIINVSYSRMGFNFRFTDIQASIGLVQLSRLKDKVARLMAIYEKYSTELTSLNFLKFIPVSIERGEIPLYCEILSQERNRLMDFLANNDIQTRPFYPDLHLAGYLGCSGEFPNSRVFSTQGLFLPCGPAQPLENIDRVIKVLGRYK